MVLNCSLAELQLSYLLEEFYLEGLRVNDYSYVLNLIGRVKKKFS
jgi:hypothetical protein